MRSSWIIAVPSPAGHRLCVSCATPGAAAICRPEVPDARCCPSVLVRFPSRARRRRGRDRPGQARRPMEHRRDDREGRVPVLHDGAARDQDVAGFGIARGMSQLTLAMFSQKWKLEKGTSYPVTLVAGSAREELQAKVESATAVAVDLTGRDAFVEGLARVPALEVRAAASTLRLPLDQGAAALARLRDYLASEAPAPSNPFASAAERPGGGQAANPFKAPAQPEATAPAAKPPAPAPAAAPRMADEAYAKARADCEQDADPDRQVAGCTTVIESGRETQAVQGIASSSRGFGYYKKGRPGALDRELYRGDSALSGIRQSALGARRRPRGSAGLGRGHRRLHRGAKARS